jgi:hypothetical protein
MSAVFYQLVTAVSPSPNPEVAGAGDGPPGTPPGPGPQPAAGAAEPGEASKQGQHHHAGVTPNRSSFYWTRCRDLATRIARVGGAPCGQGAAAPQVPRGTSPRGATTVPPRGPSTPAPLPESSAGCSSPGAPVSHHKRPLAHPRRPLLRVPQGLGGSPGPAGAPPGGATGAQSALILQCEHWLEAADPKHRYGSNLRPYFEHWLAELQEREAAEAATAAARPRQARLPSVCERAWRGGGGGDEAGGCGGGESEASWPRQEGASARDTAVEAAAEAAAAAAAAGGGGSGGPGKPRALAHAHAVGLLHPTADDSQIANAGRHLMRLSYAGCGAPGAAGGCGAEACTGRSLSVTGAAAPGAAAAAAGGRGRGLSVGGRRSMRKSHSAPRLTELWRTIDAEATGDGAGPSGSREGGPHPSTAGEQQPQTLPPLPEHRPPQQLQPLLSQPQQQQQPQMQERLEPQHPAAAARGAPSANGCAAPDAAPPSPPPPPPPRPHRSAADARFLFWLDEGCGRHVDLSDRGVPRWRLESERVQYLTPAELDRLEVTVDAARGGLLVYRASGALVDTGSEVRLVPAAPEGAAAAAPAAGSGGGSAVAAAGETGSGGGGGSKSSSGGKKGSSSKDGDGGKDGSGGKGSGGGKAQKHKGRSSGFEMDALT